MARIPIAKARGRLKPFRRLPATLAAAGAGLAGLLLTGAPVTAAAQAGSPVTDAATAQLPPDLPAVPTFDAMTPVELHAGGKQFAVAVDSLRAVGPVAWLAIGVQSSGGATNIAYYGVHCTDQTYRVMALPGADGNWRPSSATSRWQSIFAGSRKRAEIALAYQAVCPRKEHPLSDPAALRRLVEQGLEPVPL